MKSTEFNYGQFKCDWHEEYDYGEYIDFPNLLEEKRESYSQICKEGLREMGWIK